MYKSTSTKTSCSNLSKVKINFKTQPKTDVAQKGAVLQEDFRRQVNLRMKRNTGNARVEHLPDRIKTGFKLSNSIEKNKQQVFKLS